MAANDSDSPALVLKIKSLMPGLSRSEQAVAEYIIAHPEEVIYMSVAHLAQNCGVSDPTVVRTCQRLGYKGYQSLKVSLAQDLVNPLRSRAEELKAGDDIHEIINKVFKSAVYALEFTHDTLDRKNTELAAEAFMKAKRVLIYGLGGSGPMAEDMQHKLLRLNINAAAYTDNHLQAMTSAYAEKGDLVFAISNSGSSKDVVDNTLRARENGAYVVSLSSMGQSPLSKISDICLYTASDGREKSIAEISSRIAELTILDSIYAYIALRSEAYKSKKADRAIDKLKY